VEDKEGVEGEGKAHCGRVSSNSSNNSNNNNVFFFVATSDAGNVSYLMHLILDAVENELSSNMQSTSPLPLPLPAVASGQSGQFHE